MIINKVNYTISAQNQSNCLAFKMKKSTFTLQFINTYFFLYKILYNNKIIIYFIIKWLYFIMYNVEVSGSFLNIVEFLYNLLYTHLVLYIYIYIIRKKLFRDQFLVIK